MYCIASKDKLDTATIGHTSSLTSPLPWVAIGGEGGEMMFENEIVAVVSVSNLYNFLELSRSVESNYESEAHLIGLLYLRYGVQVFEKLRGPFSICIVDKRDQKIMVATDRFGIRPVVYYMDNNHFILGSRIKTIIDSPQSPVDSLDYEALIDYLNLSAIPTPKTIFKRIKKLPPGHFLVLKKGEKVPAITRYYDINYTENQSGGNYFLKAIPQYIEASVKTILDYELSRGKSIGAFLSGGTDSSTLTGMIKKINRSVKTFSIGFDEPGYNELGYARIAARHFDTPHHEYIVTDGDVLKTIDIIMDAYDEPFGNASAVPTFFCARLAKEHGIDTLLAGDGGDEIWGGNERYAKSKVFDIYHYIPHLFRKGIFEPVINNLHPAFPLVEKTRKYVRRANIPQPERFFSYNPVMALGKEAIFSPDLLRYLNGYDPMAWAKTLYHDAIASNDLNRFLYIDMKFTITDNDLRKVTTMSERAGVRVAYPLLDHPVVDLSATIPAGLKVKGTCLRYIFKEAMKDFLPDEIIKKKKHGFGLPIGVWIRTKKNISSLVKDTLLSSNCTIRTFFRKDFIEDLFGWHDTTGATFYGDIIWLLLILELWNKRNNSFRFSGSVDNR